MLPAPRLDVAFDDAYQRRFDSGSPWQVLTCVPEIEVMLFDLPDALRRLSGRSPSEDLLDLGKAAPRRALTRLFGAAPDSVALFGQLTDAEVRILRQRPDIARLRAFLGDTTAASMAS